MDDLEERMPEILSEVYAVLVALGDEYIKKLPPDVWEDIIRLKDNTYNPYVDEDVFLHEQKLLHMDDTITFIGMLKLDYWCETEEEKQELLAIMEENEAAWQETLTQTASLCGKLKILEKDKSENQ